jgi:hypothetical protein
MNSEPISVLLDSLLERPPRRRCQLGCRSGSRAWLNLSEKGETHEAQMIYFGGDDHERVQTNRLFAGTANKAFEALFWHVSSHQMRVKRGCSSDH